MPLEVCTDLSPAAWLNDGEAPEQELISLGPSGFPAYARLRFIPDPAYPGQCENEQFDESAPAERERLRRALDILLRHTTTPQQCHFCLWDGWGWTIRERDGEWSIETEQRGERPLDTPTWPDVMPSRYVEHRRAGTPAAAGDAVPGRYVPLGRGAAPAEPCAPKLVRPNRAYFLLRGAITDILERPELPDPAFVWPADRRWCLTKDVDPHWAGIAGSEAVVADLLADPLLDVVPAEFGAPLPLYR